MILIERYYKNGNPHYHLSDLETGREKEWTPPRTLPHEQIRNALIQVATIFESEIPCNDEPRPCVTLGCIPSKSASLNDFAEQFFFPRKAITLAENTLVSWRRCFNLRIAPKIGFIPIGEISPIILSDFMLNCQAEGLATSSVMVYYTILRSIFRTATKFDIISTNPMDKVDRPANRKNEMIPSSVPTFSAEEIANIESVLAREPTKWKALTSILIDTGIRVGECCGIKWEDIDFRNRTITISRSVGYTPGKGVYETTPKNRRSRTISISLDIIDMLFVLYISNLATYNSEYVFCQRRSAKPMSPQTPGAYLRKLGRRAGIDHLHPHKLRHSFASVAITNGADVASVSEILGHHDKAFTLQTYTTSNSDAMLCASEVRRIAVMNYYHP